VRFIWDAGKSDQNLNQRGFSFADASRVFDDPHRWIEPAKSKDGEIRRLTLGRAFFEPAPSLLTVIYKEREINGKKTVRIISTRAASRREARKLDSQNGNLNSKL
jgi:uncharacterized DUF497 family protein